MELLLLPDVGVVVVARKTEVIFNGAGVVVYANVEAVEDVVVLVLRLDGTGVVVDVHDDVVVLVLRLDGDGVVVDVHDDVVVLVLRQTDVDEVADGVVVLREVVVDGDDEGVVVDANVEDIEVVV